MTNVIKLYPPGAAKDPDNVLEQAKEQYQDVFIIGYDKDGDLDVRASTGLSQANIIHLIEMFKFNLFKGDYDD